MDPVVRAYMVDGIRINEGGMSRCCINTLAGWVEPWYNHGRAIPVNTVIGCLYAPDDDSHVWILDSTGTIRWYKESLA